MYVIEYMSTTSVKLYKQANTKSKWCMLGGSKSECINLYLQAAKTAGSEENIQREIKSYKKAANMLKKQKEYLCLANCYLIIGHLKWETLNEYTGALKYYTKSLNIYTDIESYEHIANVLKTIALMYESKAMKYNNVLSQIYYKNVDINKALYMYQQALIYYKQLNDVGEIVCCKEKINNLMGFLDRYKFKKSSHIHDLTDSPSISMQSSYISSEIPTTSSSPSTPEYTSDYNNDVSEDDLSQMIASQFLV